MKRRASLGSRKWKMSHLLMSYSLVISVVFLTACASAIPPARIGNYISSTHRASNSVFTTINQRPLQAGLVVVSDTADPGAAPNLPEAALTHLGESLQSDLGHTLPLVINEIIASSHIRPQPYGGWAQFVDLGREHGVDFLAVVIVSSTEQEYPATFSLGRASHAQPGFRRDNWSLLEFVLLDLKHYQVLMQAEGRGWASLDRPGVPGIDQWYPAVYLRPQDDRHIWPPTYEGAPNTLRVVSFEQAAKRLVLKLQNSWLGFLQSEAAARKSGFRGPVRQ